MNPESDKAKITNEECPECGPGRLKIEGMNACVPQPCPAVRRVNEMETTSVCKNCQMPIILKDAGLDGQMWLHMDNLSVWCRSTTKAEPVYSGQVVVRC